MEKVQERRFCFLKQILLEHSVICLSECWIPANEIYVCSRWEKCITLLPCRTRDNPHVSLWSILVQKLQLVFIIQVIKKDIWGLCLDFALLEWIPNHFFFILFFFGGAAFLCTSLGLGYVRLIFIYFFCSILNLDFFYIYNMWLSSFINYEPLPNIVFFLFILQTLKFKIFQ